MNDTYDYVRAWCRMMDTSVMIQLIAGQETAIHFKWEAGRDYATLEALRGVLPARFHAAPPAPDGRVPKTVLRDFCMNEIDARIPARA